MKNALTSLAIGLSLLSGCAASPAPVSPATPAARGGATAGSVEGRAPRAGQPLSVTIAPQATSGRVRVTIEVERADLLAWSRPSDPNVRVEAFAARDASGPVAWTESRTGVVLGSERTIEPPLELSYEISDLDGSRAVCPSSITPDQAFFCGGSVLLSPVVAADQRTTARLVLRPDGHYLHEAASSLGLEDDLVSRASFADLERAAFVFGNVGNAYFSAPEGRDHAAWLGFFSFDTRWAAAEAAGMRTMTDRWLGLSRPADDPSAGLLFVNAKGPSRVLDVRRAFRGALVEAGVSATWTARSRVDVTRLFVQRTLGGSIRAEADDAAAAAWFEEGFAHAVSVNVLRDAGMLTHDEVAAEINSLIVEDALSPLHGRSEAELLALSAPGGESRQAAFRLLAARGALVGVALSDPNDNQLQHFLRELRDGKRTVSKSALRECLAKRDGERADALIAAFERGGTIPLRARDVGPCVTLESRTVHRFELGFSFEPLATAGGTITSVVPGSAAARAGLRTGDVFASLDFVPDAPNSPVKIALGEDGARRIDFFPRGSAAKARVLVARDTTECR